MPITTRIGKGSALTHAELDGNFTDLDGRVSALVAGAASDRDTLAEVGNILDTKANLLTPVVISASGPLTAAAHGNRLLLVDTAGLTLTINNDATGGWSADDALDIQAIGAGTFTLVQGTATLTTDSGASAASTTAVGKRVQAQRSAANNWRTISPVIVNPAGSGPVTYLRDDTDYTVPDDTVRNLIGSPIALGALPVGTTVRATIILELAGGTAHTAALDCDVQGTEVFQHNSPGSNTNPLSGEIVFAFHVKSATTLSAVQQNSNYGGVLADPITVASMAAACTLQFAVTKSAAGRVTKVRGIYVEVWRP